MASVAALVGIGKGVKNLVGGTQSNYAAQGADPAQLNTAYNQTQAAIAQQKQFVQALQAQNGLGNQSNVFNQQQNLANELQGVANGTGPNPAQNMLNQATGQNVSNQAALMAGQRGAGANVGLIARQAAMQGANTQQQAAGQAATMQSQQQLNALGQMGQQQANMANLATNQVGQQQSGIQNLGQQSLQQQSNLMGLQSNVNNVNAGVAAANQQSHNQMIGNLMHGAGTAAMMLAEGGKVDSGPSSYVTKHIMMAHGGKVPALVSPGEKYLKPKDVEAVKQGASPMKQGETIKGEAKVKGAVNSYANDTVKKNLDEGGIVIPRSVTQGKDAEKKAAEFVRAVLSKDKLRKK